MTNIYLKPIVSHSINYHYYAASLNHDMSNYIEIELPTWEYGVSIGPNFLFALAKAFAYKRFPDHRYENINWVVVGGDPIEHFPIPKHGLF